ncbi:hypothetical protein NL676_020309 [Syzygium grande]|nr:hypothetical protein NL676_020309 [Syzygium grande]
MVARGDSEKLRATCKIEKFPSHGLAQRGAAGSGTRLGSWRRLGMGGCCGAGSLAMWTATLAFVGQTKGLVVMNRMKATSVGVVEVASPRLTQQ